MGKNSKSVLFSLLLNLVISQYAICQSIDDKEIIFCHDKEQRLVSCTVDHHYILKFDNSSLKSIYTKDSSIFYDVEKKHLKINTKDNNIVTIQLLNNGNVVVYDTKNDTFYKRPFMNSEYGNLTKTSTYIDSYNINTSFLTFSYKDSVLQHVSFGDFKSGNFNMEIYKSNTSGLYSWDISLSPISIGYDTIGKSIKVLINKELSQPYIIGICDKIHSFMYKRDPGIEIISNSKSMNFFNLIRTVKATENKGIFLYRDEITYKNGKVKKTSIPIIQCD